MQIALLGEDVFKKVEVIDVETPNDDPRSRPNRTSLTGPSNVEEEISKSDVEEIPKLTYAEVVRKRLSSSRS